MRIVGDDAVNNIIKTLTKNPEGLTITEIVEKTGKPRSFVRTQLAKLEGGNKVVIRNVGMAKIYKLQ